MIGLYTLGMFLYAFLTQVWMARKGYGMSCPWKFFAATLLWPLTSVFIIGCVVADKVKK